MSTATVVAIRPTGPVVGAELDETCRTLDLCFDDLATACADVVKAVGAIAQETERVVAYLADEGMNPEEAWQLVADRYAGRLSGADPKVRPQLRTAGYSQSATAEIFGVSREAIKNQESRGRAKSGAKKAAPHTDDPDDISPELQAAYDDYANCGSTCQQNVWGIVSKMMKRLKREYAETDPDNRPDHLGLSKTRAAELRKQFREMEALINATFPQSK